MVFNVKIDPKSKTPKNDLNSPPKENKFIQSTMEKDENFLEALKFIKTIPAVELFDRPRRSIPKKNDPRKTLILDLDETLVHSSIEPQSNPDDVFMIEMNDNK